MTVKAKGWAGTSQRFSISGAAGDPNTSNNRAVVSTTVTK